MYDCFLLFGFEGYSGGGIDEYLNYSFFKRGNGVDFNNCLIFKIICY
jgi:hypothetical protein